jgi:hypothetical protein
MTEEFNKWWDKDDLTTQGNPYTYGTPVYWAWEGWQAALAAPVQEPVMEYPDYTPGVGWRNLTPPAAQRQWVGLKDEEKRQIFEREDYQGWLDYINTIEAKLKEKNNG